MMVLGGSKPLHGIFFLGGSLYLMTLDQPKRLGAGQDHSVESISLSQCDCGRPRHILCVLVLSLLCVVHKSYLSQILHHQSINRRSVSVVVGDHGAPFASVTCLHTALCHTHFRHLAHVASPTLSSSSSASFSIHLALQH